jgi:hypothetical protein
LRLARTAKRKYGFGQGKTKKIVIQSNRWILYVANYCELLRIIANYCELLRSVGCEAW